MSYGAIPEPGHARHS